jgi:hypothetical protein
MLDLLPEIFPGLAQVPANEDVWHFRFLIFDVVGVGNLPG